jgi:Lar family restriction alleviation protein
MSELLPCPFCGGEAEMLTAQSMNGGYLFGIMCNDCRSRGDVYDTEAEAIAAWNSRADYHGYEQAAIEAWESIKAWNSRAERTCKQEERGWGTEGDHARVWLTCGHDCMVPTVQDLPNYCPKCGCKVVDE